MKSSCSPCMCLALFHPDFHSIVAHGTWPGPPGGEQGRDTIGGTYSDYRMKSSCSPCMCLALFHPDFHSIVAHGQDHLEVSKDVTRSEARFDSFASMFIESCFRNNHGAPIVTIE